MYSRSEIKAAFDTPHNQRTPRQHAICEHQLPTLPPRSGDELDAEFARRLQAGLPLSRDARRRARAYLKRSITP